jgi:hypothetical protein
MSTFRIFDVKTKTFVPGLEFEDGQSAAAEAEVLTIRNGTKFQPRKVKEVLDEDYMNTFVQYTRFNNVFNYIPYTREAAGARYLVHGFRHHLTHQSEMNPMMVAFFATEEDAKRHKWTHTKMGRYLTEYFSQLGKANIDDRATSWDSANEPADVRLATEPEAIEEVFRKADFGCASAPTWPKEYPHPCLIYHSPDIAVAYWVKGESYKARGICFPERKLFTRGYGSCERLSSGLITMGYKQSQSVFHTPHKDLEGVRLRKLRDPRYPKRWLGVHMDWHPDVKHLDDTFWSVVLKRTDADACFRVGTPYALRRDRDVILEE